MRPLISSFLSSLGPRPARARTLSFWQALKRSEVVKAVDRAFPIDDGAGSSGNWAISAALVLESRRCSDEACSSFEIVWLAKKLTLQSASLAFTTNFRAACPVSNLRIAQWNGKASGLAEPVLPVVPSGCGRMGSHGKASKGGRSLREAAVGPESCLSWSPFASSWSEVFYSKKVEFIWDTTSSFDRILSPAAFRL